MFLHTHPHTQRARTRTDEHDIMVRLGTEFDIILKNDLIILPRIRMLKNEDENPMVNYEVITDDF